MLLEQVGMPRTLPTLSEIPLISVVMAVKNGGNLIKESISSIQNQTYSNFELIIINDGSVDDTESVILEFAKFDKRIKIYSQENQGLSKSLNRALSIARGELIARQDHDDLSMPNRFEMQVRFLKNHPSCALLGTAAEIWDMNGPTGRFHDHPINSQILKYSLIFNNPFVHSSLVFHRSILQKVGLYSTEPSREPPEDYEFISRVARSHDVFNLPNRLVIYRETPGSISSEIRPDNNKLKSISQFQNNLALISAENLANANALIEPDINCIEFGRILHVNSSLDLRNLHYRKIRTLLFAAIANCRVVDINEQKICIGLIKEFYLRYFSFKKLSLSQIIIFSFSGFNEIRFILEKIYQKLK